VALVEDGRGGEILPKLIRKLDDIVCNGETELNHLAQARLPRPH
jgi:hypothetical protein